MQHAGKLAPLKDPKKTKPNMQWTDLIYPIQLTYNNKKVHSSTGLTPNEARKPSNELESFINMKMRAKHNRQSKQSNENTNTDRDTT